MKIFFTLLLIFFSLKGNSQIVVKGNISAEVVEYIKNLNTINFSDNMKKINNDVNNFFILKKMENGKLNFHLILD